MDESKPTSDVGVEKPHLGPESVDVTDDGPQNQHQNVLFADKSATYGLNIKSANDPTYDDGRDESVPLGDFLSRPTKIGEITWTAFTDLHTTLGAGSIIDPWTLWQNDARVKAKLENYSYLRCKLNVKFVINGTPFHYGRLMITYVPHMADNSIFQDADSTLYTSGAASAHDACWQYLSTYPHGFLDPCLNEPVNMQLPFVWHNNYIPVAGSTSATKATLGSFRLNSLNQLRVANTSCPQAVNIAIFAWAEDVVLTAPTEFVPTSSQCESDEYEDGPVSGPASAVASAAGKLKNVPVIGRFAMATEIGAGAVGSIARLFGFSGPPRVPGGDYAQLTALRNLAQPNGVDSAESLTLDPKCELTIDPAVIGFGGKDEMVISSIVSRYQWLCKALWKSDVGQFTTAGCQQIICASLVTPTQIRKTGAFGVPATTAHAITPAGFVGRTFKYWKGSITYKVEVVCTQKHSGKLMIQFDPFKKNGAYAATDFYTEEVNGRKTAILDLQASNSIEFRIDYVSDRPYLENDLDLDAKNFAPLNETNVVFDLHSHVNQKSQMGMLIVSIVNDLVAPIETDGAPSATKASVDVNLWMKCEENMEFAMPRQGFEDDVFKATADQLAEDPYQPDTWQEHALIDAEHSSANSKVFFGERVLSLRTLVKRSCLVRIHRPNTTNDTFLAHIRYRFSHYTPETVHGGDRVNTYQSYFSPMYLAQRGSMRWRFLAAPNRQLNNSGTMILTRAQSEAAVSANDVVTNIDAYNSTQLLALTPRGGDGMIVSAIPYRPSVEATFPWYSNTRYNLACSQEVVDSANNITVNPTMDGVLFEELHVDGIGCTNRIIEVFASAGEDYSCMFFLAPPIIYTQ